MLFPFVLAAALLPVTQPLATNTCVTQAQLADVPPRGATRDFLARHTIFDRMFAFTSEYFEETGGAQAVWRKRGTTWCVVSNPKDYLDEPTMIRLGVPQKLAHHFRLEAGKYLQQLAFYRARADKAVDAP